MKTMYVKVKISDRLPEFGKVVYIGYEKYPGQGVMAYVGENGYWYCTVDGLDGECDEPDFWLEELKS